MTLIALITAFQLMAPSAHAKDYCSLPPETCEYQYGCQHRWPNPDCVDTSPPPTPKQIQMSGAPTGAIEKTGD